jgi:2-dehydro-3-deoxyphosphogluconate aldolase/(4S)-4-hydroxy-2-oxoglutarate aldolase
MDIFEELSAHGVVPVIEIEDAEAALPLADALEAGGLPVAEITFRTPAARDAIAAIAAHRPGILLGAGTVLRPAQVDEALEAGARFGLAPGLNGDVLARSAEAGLPFAPGVMTPGEIEAALSAGCRMVKFFPAMAAGGPAMLKAIAGPYAHTGLCYNPTGGVTPENMADWLALPQVRAVGGTWIASRSDIVSGNWEAIADNARAAVAQVAAFRGG